MFRAVSAAPNAITWSDIEYRDQGDVDGQLKIVSKTQAEVSDNRPHNRRHSTPDLGPRSVDRKLWAIAWSPCFSDNCKTLIVDCYV